jgi:hypothetical protein
LKSYTGGDLLFLREHAESRGLVYNKAYYDSLKFNFISLTEQEVLDALDKEVEREKESLEKKLL